MTPDEYVKAAVRTKSESFYGENVPIETLVDSLLAAEVISTDLDDCKKALYYNTFSLNPENKENSDQVLEKVSLDNLHGILGIATEAGELVQALLRPMLNKNTEFDVVNLEEEIGDVMWYIALLCHENNLSLESVMQKNISKLMKRYPEKFTVEKANNRDLDAERALLEEQV